MSTRGAADALPETPRFYGRRKGKTLKVTARKLLDGLLPRLEIPEPGPQDRIDPAALFDRPMRQIWLEIGFGGGEHLAAQAARNPDVGFIGSEVFRNGVASLLKHLDAGGQDNLRIFAEDVRRLFPALPDASLDRAFLLFPDPWPKARHAFRRFINPENLDQLARLLKPGAELRVASDDPTYQDWVREQMPLRSDFAPNFGPGDDLRQRPGDWQPTRYEQKAMEAGRIPMYFSYRRA